MGRVSRLLKAANAARLKVYLLALWKLVKHRDTPRPLRWLAFAVLAYAVSPIDLIPDFIPVLGLLDDLIIVPLGLALVARLAPPELWQARLREAEAQADDLPKLLWGAAGIVALWLLVLALLVGAVTAFAAPVQPAAPANGGHSDRRSDRQSGRIVRVLDARTVVLAPAGATPAVTLQLSGIEPPLPCQPWAGDARAAFSGWLLDQEATAVAAARGSAAVALRIDGVSINRRMVEEGHAWSETGRNGHGPYLLAQERMALSLRRGLHQAGADRPERPRDLLRRRGGC